MPSIYETLIGAPPSGEEETRATARQLRGRQELGMLGVITGDEVLSKLGAGMMSQTQKRVEGLQKTRQKGIVEQRERDRQAAIEANWAASQAMDQAELEETIRWHDMQEKIKQDAARYKKTDRTGKYPSQKAEEKMVKEITDARAMTNIRATFRPEFGSGGIQGALGLGTAENVMGRLGVGGEGAEEQAFWWSEYKRVRELVQRHELFGSALTTGEQKSWKEANIGPADSPQMIEMKLEVMEKLSNKVLLDTIDRTRGRYDPDFEAALYGDLLGQGPSAAPSSPSAPTPVSTQGYSYTVDP